MYYSKYFPFLTKSPQVDANTRIVNTSDLFLPPPYDEWGKDTPIGNFTPSANKFMLNKKPKVLKVLPLGFYVMFEPAAVVRYYKKITSFLMCDVIDVDYSVTARKIELLSSNDEDELDFSGGTARYPGGLGGETSEDIVEARYIVAAENGETVYYEVGTKDYIPHTIETGPGSTSGVPLEDVTLKNGTEQVTGFQNNPSVLEIDSSTIDALSSSPQSGTDISNAPTPLEIRLENYITSSYVTERVPMLLGGTATAKSATIKALADKHGMRLVDLRTAFMDRLDLEGLAEIVEVGGKRESYNATMEQFVQCSDAYIRFCKEAVIKIDEKIKEVSKLKDYPPEKLTLLKESFENYKEGAKIPILFFDEVTRCKPEIRNCLTKILNEKSFNFMDMKMCRIVAAANVPLGLPEELESLYIGSDEVKDVAFLDRFEPLPVTPEAMHATWLKWAKTQGKPKGRTNIHQMILDYLGNDLLKTFNNQAIIDAYNVDFDMDDVTTTPFPNFRAWEMITDYLYQLEDQGRKDINQFVIDGLIGKSDSESFVSFLVGKSYLLGKATTEKKTISNKDKLDSIVEEGMLCNIPTMLIGPSGLGKTTKVRNIAKKYNAEFIQINLARSDSTDIMGMPCKIDLTERIGGKMEDIDKDLAKDLKGMVANFDLPAEVTIKAPRSNIKGRFEKAYREGRYVILFFDELNRVTDESLMSAVFEAVSDNRIFGIDFNPARVKIFAACNLGENTPDAGRLDPAFTARFCLYRKKVYDLDDVDSILEFVENEGYDPILLKYLKDMPKDKFLTMVQEIEARTIKKSVPSTRALKDLNGMIGTVKSDPIMGGTILFPNRNFTAIYSELFSVGTLTEVRDVLINLDSKIFPRMPNWSGLDSNITQNFEIVAGKMKNADAKELISWYKDLKGLVFQGGEITPEVEKNIKAMKYVVAQIYAIDLEIKKKRETVTEYIIGDQSADFMSFYNSYSGTMIVQLKIKDLKDINNVTPFLEQQAVTVEATGILTLFTDLVMEFLKEFKDSLSKEHYQTFIKEMIRISTTRESAQALVEGIIRDLSADKIFVYAQDEKFVFTKAIMDAIQLPVSDEEIEAMTQKKKVAAPKAKIL